MLIPSDPIETKGVQLQVLALILNEHPDALTDEQRADLSRIFDLDAFVASFDPSSSDPLKSTGPLARKTRELQYETVQPEDWDTFNAIVLDVGARYPGDRSSTALFLKSYRYLDPFDEGTDWYPPWSDGVRPHHRRLPGRAARRQPGRARLDPRPRLRLLRRLGVPAADLARRPHRRSSCCCWPRRSRARRRFAWLWALPFALQLAIAGVSPLSAGGRYVLAFTYGLAVVLLLLAVEDRRRRRPSRRRGPSPTPSEHPAVAEEVRHHPDRHRDDLGAGLDQPVGQVGYDARRRPRSRRGSPATAGPGPRTA